MSAVNQVHSMMNAAGMGGLISGASPSILTGNKIPERSYGASTNKTVFSGKVEVIKVANGYLVNIGRTEGYEFETHIANDIVEVNAIITAQLVAFRLEGK